MRLPKPKFVQTPEVYEGIAREHREDPLRMGEVLMAYGWTLADSAWVVVNWDLLTLAAAIADERFKRNQRLAPPTETNTGQIEPRRPAEKKATSALELKKAVQIVRTTPKIPLRPPKEPRRLDPDDL